MMGLTLQELIRLGEQTYTALGWNGYGMHIEYGEREDDDIWLYYDVHPSAMEPHDDLYDAFDNLYGQLGIIWGDKAKSIEFHDTDDDDNLSGYYAAIELAETVEEEA